MILFTKDGNVIETNVCPYAHQRRELEEHGLDKARALPWGMRTGKSMVAVSSASALWQYAKIDAVIVISPSRVHHAWAKDEFPKHCTVPFITHSWTCCMDDKKKEKSKRRALTQSQVLAVLAVNKEALLVKRVWAFIKRFMLKKRCFLIVDESHHFGSPGSRGTKRIRALSNRCQYRRILSGTMVGNHPGRVYSQFQILKKGALGYDTSSDFLQAHGVFTYDGRHWQQDKKQWQNKELLRKRMAKWGRPVLRSDCEDLPPVITTSQYVEMSETVFDAHTAAMAEAGLTDPPNFFPARRAAMRNKPEALLEILPGVLEKGPVVVWVPFTDEIDALENYLHSEDVEAAAHHGKLTTKEREYALSYVREKQGVLVSTPDSLQEGMDLSWAKTIIWYAPPWDSITFEQARERCTAMGGGAVDEILLITNNSIEEIMYKCLERKTSVANWLGGEGLRDWMEENDG